MIAITNKKSENKLLLVTFITMADVEQKLRVFLSDIAKKQGYAADTLTIKPISSGGANFSSTLYFAKTTSPNKEDLHLFAKVAALSAEMRASMPDNIFDMENFVYGDLAEKFKQIEDKHNLPKEDRYVFCKYYGSKLNDNEETIVLENLDAKGFVVYDRMKSIDWPYASKAVEELAKYHALAMAYEEEYPEECKHKCEFYLSRLEQAWRMMEVPITKFVDLGIKTTRAENRDKLTRFFENKANRDYGHYTKPLRKTVLIHGDYRPSNLMHQIYEDSSMQVIPLDFQTIRGGCVVSDLLYFIFTSTDKEFRDKHYEDLVKLYYERLRKSLRAMNYDPEKIYSREDFEYELKEIMPYGLMVAVFLLPIITVETQDAPDFKEDNLFENMAKAKTSSLYPDRLNGVVDDFVRWGII